MKAYFTRKPMTIEDAKVNAAWAKAERQEPVEVTPIASVPLTPAQYAAFCKAPLRDWDFLAPYADQSGFTKDGADCVIIECEDGLMRSAPALLPEGVELIQLSDAYQ